MARKGLGLGEHDQIVGAWCEAPAGPGWSNRLVWVCIRSALDGSHRVDALQPDEQSAQMVHLFNVCRAASDDLIGWVRAQEQRPRAARLRRAGGKA